MIFDGGFVAPGYEDYLCYSGRYRFLDRVLDQRLVHHRQHFLGARFGDGKKARTHSGDRKNGLGNLGHCFPCSAISRSTMGYPSNSNNPASSSTGTPSSRALSNFPPGSAPATT